MAPLVVALGFGCAPATIYRPDGPPMKAVIEDSDAITLRVRDESGARHALGQLQVSEIDHPGNVGFIGGLVSLVLGVVVLASSYDGGYGDGWHLMTRYLFGYPLTLAGVAGVGAGAPIWLRSRRAAREFNLARPPAAQIPPGVYER